MTDADYWDVPPDQEVDGYGESAITLVLPPFHPHSRCTPASVADFTAHDPARARAFADSFPTIEALLEELPLTTAGPEFPSTRADLDLVRVGCWGDIIAISDHALADPGGIGYSLLDQTSALAERYPDARIIGEASIDCGENHVETAIHLPGGLSLHSEGWPAGDWYDLDGDPHAIVHALGIGPDVLAEAYIDLDESPRAVPWTDFGSLVLAPFDPWGYEALQMSHFRVRHTEGATYQMEDVWFVE